MTARTALPAGVALALATPIATWWLVGDQSEPAPPGTDLTHAVQPVPLDPDLERAIGICAVALVAITAGWLIVLSARRRLDRRWWSVLDPVLVAGVIAGMGWRVVTAGVTGDGLRGLVVIVGGPVVAALLLYAAFRAWRLLSSRPLRSG
jgi:hypothetical protein